MLSFFSYLTTKSLCSAGIRIFAGNQFLRFAHYGQQLQAFGGLRSEIIFISMEIDILELGQGNFCPKNSYSVLSYIFLSGRNARTVCKFRAFDSLPARSASGMTDYLSIW